MTNTQYDIIIIGGGIAGLYAAYKILEKTPQKNILVLEREKQIGGRIGNEMFHGTSIVTGAGVGRKEKDHLLTKLLHDIEVPYNEFPAKHHYANTIEPKCNTKAMFMKLRKEFKNLTTHSHKTFKEFATFVLGKDEYQNFIICSGYTDYENEDVYDTLYNYGFEDNYGEWTAMGINWNLLVKTMVKKIGSRKILGNQNVVKIDIMNESIYQIHTTDSDGSEKIYECKKMILATTIDSVLKLLPNASGRNSIYRQIQGQPFLRVYGKFSKESIPILQNYIPSLTIVPGPLQKIIPMNPEKGVYMIAYSDNNSALVLKPFLDNTIENREIFALLVEDSLNIPQGSLTLVDMIDYYFDIGTHYYNHLREPFKNRSDFIKKAQRPFDNIFIVGEMISINQGWVEGSLESVENILQEV